MKLQSLIMLSIAINTLLYNPQQKATTASQIKCAASTALCTIPWNLQTKAKKLADTFIQKTKDQDIDTTALQKELALYKKEWEQDYHNYNKSTFRQIYQRRNEWAQEVLAKETSWPTVEVINNGEKRWTHYNTSDIYTWKTSRHLTTIPNSALLAPDKFACLYHEIGHIKQLNRAEFNEPINNNYEKIQQFVPARLLMVIKDAGLEHQHNNHTVTPLYRQALEIEADLYALQHVHKKQAIQFINTFFKIHCITMNNNKDIRAIIAEKNTHLETIRNKILKYFFEHHPHHPPSIMRVKSLIKAGCKKWGTDFKKQCAQHGIVLNDIDDYNDEIIPAKRGYIKN